MIISDIHVYWLRVELPESVSDAMSDLSHWDVIAVRVDTSAGIAGWGYNCTIGEGSRALLSLIEDDLKPRFIGADPFLVRKLWQVHYLDRFSTSLAGFGFQGVAAIEIALWDIIAKSSGQPLWRILGGWNSGDIPIYSTDGGWLGFSRDELVANALRIQAAGFRGFKMKIGKPDLEEDLERVRAVRQALGPNYPVMVDANGRWDAAAAIRAARLLEPLNILWFEEPVHPLDVRAHAQLAQATTIPVLAGESICDIRLFRDLMVERAIGIAQPDVLKLGGISNWMDVAALARAFGLPIVPAGFNLMQIDVHLLAATSNGWMMEHIPWIQPLFERPLHIHNGKVAVPTVPGVGADIRSEALERFSVV